MTFFEDEWQNKVPGTARPLGAPEDEEPPWVTNAALYRDYEIDTPNGPQSTRFYTLGAVALALGKTDSTVRRWIRTHVIPDAGMRTEPIIGTLGNAGRRLWTREQIDTLVTIARDEGVIGGPRKADFAATNFSPRAWDTWRQRDW